MSHPQGEFYRSPRRHLYWKRDDEMFLWGEHSKQWVKIHPRILVRKTIATEDLQREDRDAYEAAVDETRHDRSMSTRAVLRLTTFGALEPNDEFYEEAEGRTGSQRYRKVRDGLAVAISSGGRSIHPEPHTPVQMVVARRGEGELAEAKQTTVEDALRIKTNQLAAVATAMTVFLETENWRMASDEILRSALSQTGSEYGFIGVVVDGPALRILSHEGIKWDSLLGRTIYDAAMRTYRELGYLEFTNFENLFGRVISDGKAIISNDPETDRRSGGRPAGHPPLLSFLGVPILRRSGLLLVR